MTDSGAPKTIYTVEQVAETLSVSPKTVRNQIASGKLKAHRFGRRYYIKAADLERALKPVHGDSFDS